ncbi:MAG: DUF2914 domain-containing protein [Gammaproteobacteria bacterium]
MSPLSDDYILSLEPETLRYDVTIFDDFVISVLPNGIKTWAFLYDYEGRKRRKTLGVYPDMTYEQAEDALDNVRGMIAKLGDDIKDSPVDDNTPTVAIPEEVMDAPAPVAPEPPTPAARPAVLATRKRYRQRRSRSIKLPTGWIRPFALGLALVIGLGAVVFVVPKLDLFGGTSDAQVTKPVPGNRGPAEPILLDDPAPAPGSETPDSNDATAPRGVDPPAPAPNADASSISPPPTTDVAPPVRAAPIETPEAITVAAAEQPPATLESVPVTTVDVTPDLIPDEPVLAQAPVDTTPVAEERVAEEPVAEEPVAEELVAAAPIAKAVEPIVSRLANAPEGATSTNGQVSRAVVSSGVEDLEPLDDLGSDVVLSDGGYQTVFYFTELRNFNAGHVVHRWTVNGKVIADVPLRVGGGWRWRTYSSKDLLPGMTGDWSVAVIDGDGNILGERRFQFNRSP